MPVTWRPRTVACVAGFGWFVLLLVLAQFADVQRWDAPNLDQETLAPLLRIVSTVGLLVGTWSFLHRDAEKDVQAEAP